MQGQFRGRNPMFGDMTFPPRGPHSGREGRRCTPIIVQAVNGASSGLLSTAYGKLPLSTPRIMGDSLTQNGYDSQAPSML